MIFVDVRRFSSIFVDFRRFSKIKIEAENRKSKIENRKLKAPTTIALGLPWTRTTRPELAQSSPRTRSRLRSGCAQLAVPAQLEVESFRRRLELAQSSPRARLALAQGSLRARSGFAPDQSSAGTRAELARNSPRRPPEHPQISSRFAHE